MQSGFEDNKFYVEYFNPGRAIGNMREELNIAVKQISESSGDKLLLSLSSGLDSQVILQSLHEQKLPYTCAFMHMPGYNDHEHANIKILEEKYGFKSIVVKINPDKVKDEILEQAYTDHLLPNHFMHKKFLSKLPKDMDFLNGIEGPDIVYNPEKKNRLVMEAYWNFENTRLRILRTVKRTGRVLNIDRNETSEAYLASILKDPVIRGYVNSIEYILDNGLVDSNGKKPAAIYNWNYYVKPIIMGKYWGKDLIYFPKSMGVEKIDWIMNCPIRQPYWMDVTYVDYYKLRDFLLSDQPGSIKVYGKNQVSESFR